MAEIIRIFLIPLSLAAIIFIVTMLCVWGLYLHQMGLEVLNAENIYSITNSSSFFPMLSLIASVLFLICAMSASLISRKISKNIDRSQKLMRVVNTTFLLFISCFVATLFINIIYTDHYVSVVSASHPTLFCSLAGESAPIQLDSYISFSNNVNNACNTGK